MKNQFLKVDYNLLSNPNTTLLEAIFIAYLQGYQSNNKYCFETQEELALRFNIPLRTIERLLSDLQSKKIIFKESASNLGCKRQYKNRKGYVLVDENNPLIITIIEESQPKVIESPKQEIMFISSSDARQKLSQHISKRLKYKSYAKLVYDKHKTKVTKENFDDMIKLIDIDIERCLVKASNEIIESDEITLK